MIWFLFLHVRISGDLSFMNRRRQSESTFNDEPPLLLEGLQFDSTHQSQKSFINRCFTMPRKSTRLTKGLVAKYKNTSKEEMSLQDSSDEASIDIKFTNPEGHSSKEDLIESDEELESTDLNNTQTTIGEDEELGESDEVPDSNELNEKVPSSNSDEQSKEVPSIESNEQLKEVDESMFKEDSLRMARGKAPLTKSFVAKFKSTQKDISSSEREIEMNSEDNVVSLRDDENISLMPSSQTIA
ncbi:hypothetical protein L6452_09337 [Arctium lappa]|uniref:Uncharacterized protein n=1 Tax=Arctium lappa TaxID=4217 RepID=A0ACB9DK31_ARCLA|nr:hypothetical protein L6452_09337 [Arctium lappa]